MKELGSRSKTTDGKNIQGKRAKETRQTTGDAKTEQTTPEFKGSGRRVTHFFKDMVVYSTVAAAADNLLTGPALAEGLSHNNQYAPSIRGYRDTQLSRVSAVYSALESTISESDPSRYMGRNYEQFTPAVKIDGRRVPAPTMGDIKQVLKDNRAFVERLDKVCKDPRLFDELSNDKTFQNIVHSIAQHDKNLRDFMYKMCDEVKEAMIRTQQTLSEVKNGGPLNQLVQDVAGKLVKQESSAQYLAKYEETSQESRMVEAFNNVLNFARGLVAQGHEKEEQNAREKEMLHDTINKLIEKNNEKDKIWMGQDDKTKQLLDRELQRRHEEEKIETYGAIALAAILAATACCYMRRKPEGVRQTNEWPSGLREYNSDEEDREPRSIRSEESRSYRRRRDSELRGR